MQHRYKTIRRNLRNMSTTLLFTAVGIGVAYACAGSEWGETSYTHIYDEKAPRYFSTNNLLALDYDRATTRPWYQRDKAKPAPLVTRINTVLKNNGRSLQIDGSKQPIVGLLRQIKTHSPFARHWDTSPCTYSNTTDTALAFITAMAKDSSLDQASLAALISQRVDLLGQCKIDKSNSLPNAVTSSAAGKDFAQYLQAANHFYQKRYSDADVAFDQLTASSQPWIKETSQYLLGRIGLILAQRNWSGYQTKLMKFSADTGIARGRAEDAIKSLKGYIQAYPQGRYTQSAQGLLIRGYLFAGDRDNTQHALRAHTADLYQKWVASGKNDAEIADLLEMNFEPWRKLTLPAIKPDLDNDAPTLLAFWLITEMASHTDYLDLARVEKRFSAIPGLYQYLKAIVAYRQQNYTDIVDLKAAADTKQTLQTALQTMKALAHGELGNHTAAIRGWAELTQKTKTAVTHRNGKKVNYLLDTPEYEAIEYLIKTDTIEDIKHLNIQDRFLSRQVFAQVCDHRRLLTVINYPNTTEPVRNMARHELFLRLIANRRFNEAQQLLDKINDKAAFSQVRTALRRLADNPNDINANMNLAYFMEQRMMAPVERVNEESRLKYNMDSAACPSQYFDKQDFGPSHFYLKAISLAQATTKTEDEAKAIHYVIKACKHHSCMWGQAPHDRVRSKRLYQQLHRRYPNSRWTKRTKYYYKDTFSPYNVRPE